MKIKRKPKISYKMKRLLLFLLSSILILYSCKKELKQTTTTTGEAFKFCGSTDNITPQMASFITELQKKGKEYIKAYDKGLIPDNSNAVTLPFVLYINFSGETVTSSSWGNFTAASSGLNQTQIDLILAYVREDYSPFQVTITTNQATWAAAPAQSRAKCIVAAGLTSRFGSVGGIALIGTSVTPGFEEPCFVLSDNLGNLATKIGISISHEIGHTLGLYHQADVTGCTLNSQYLLGIGIPNGMSWGPIMGQPFSTYIHSWAQGKTDIFNSGTGCYDIQDEFAVITSNISYKPDDYTNTFNALQLGNLISRNTTKTGVLLPVDLDQMRCITAGTYSITVNAYVIPGVVTALWGDNQYEVRIYNSAHTLLQTIPLQTGPVSIGNPGGNFWIEIRTKPTPNYQPWNVGTGQWSITLT